MGEGRGYGRRRWMQGAAAAGLVATRCGRADEIQYAECPDVLTPAVVYAPSTAELEERARRFLDTDLGDVFALCTQEIAAVGPERVLGAILMAGALGIPPDPGDRLHGTLAIHSALHLHDALDGPNSLVPVYYAARALKKRQLSSGLLAPPPSVTVRGASEAVERFDAALEQRDPDAAEVAVLDLFASIDAPRAIERLIHWSSRDPGHIGHQMIWFGLGIRTLDRCGWEHADPVLRSIVRSATQHEPSSVSESFEDANAWLGADGLPEGECLVDDGVTVELVQELRRYDSSSAVALVKDLLERGSPQQAIWDGFVLSGADDLTRGGAGVSIHRFDTVNALRHLARRGDRITRQLIMLQIAAYLCTLEAPFGPYDILHPERADVSSVDEVFHGVARGAWVAAARVMGYHDRFGSIDALVDRGNTLTVEKARIDEHCYKFPAAVAEEVALTSPRWKPHVYAGIGAQEGRSPSIDLADWDHLEEALAEIEKL